MTSASESPHPPDDSGPGTGSSQPENRGSGTGNRRLTSGESQRRNRAERDAKATAWAAQFCSVDHRTWHSKARCLWPGKRIVGDGRWATWDPSRSGEIRLYGTRAAAATDSPGGQVVMLRKGLHRKGVRK